MATSSATGMPTAISSPHIPNYYSLTEMNKHKSVDNEGRAVYSIHDAPSGQVDDVDFYVAALEVRRKCQLKYEKLSHQVSGFDCFDTVQLLDHLVWKFEAQLVSRGYKKSSFKEIGTNFLEMQNNLKRLLEANTWGMVLCLTARVYMK